MQKVMRGTLNSMHNKQPELYEERRTRMLLLSEPVRLWFSLGSAQQNYLSKF
jgi:hypothetical protein